LLAASLFIFREPANRPSVWLMFANGFSINAPDVGPDNFDRNPRTWKQ